VLSLMYFGTEAVSASYSNAGNGIVPKPSLTSI
jgi:hypothetical protein